MQARSESLRGVYAAVINPRDEENRLDGSALARILRFLADSGIRGFALNGATGEYCRNSPADLASMLETARNSLPADAAILCGIGAADLRGVLERGRVAMAAGARAVLLPMPHFFPYEQHDLRAFCLEVAERLSIDILLYNLPQFTTGLTVATVCDLVRECPPIKGIKDSSGFLDVLRALACDLPHAVRLVGNDGVLPEALQENVCDGVVSGVAGVDSAAICEGRRLQCGRGSSAPRIHRKAGYSARAVGIEVDCGEPGTGGSAVQSAAFGTADQPGKSAPGVVWKRAETSGCLNPPRNRCAAGKRGAR
jgi:dihydrodipicolinate synthase/N-acetylneuraminate lyase